MAIIRAPVSFPLTTAPTTQGVPPVRTNVLNAIPAGGGGPPPTVGYPSS